MHRSKLKSKRRVEPALAVAVLAAALSPGALAQAAAPEVEQVVITASGVERRLFDTPYAVGVVDAQALRAAGPMVNLSEALARVPEAYRVDCAAIPLDRILIETDAPDLPPPADFGPFLLPNGAHDPRSLPAVAALLAADLNLSPESLASITTTNFQQLFTPHQPSLSTP
jgi:hypothetical protein